MCTQIVRRAGNSKSTVLLGLGEETGCAYGREWGWQATGACLCEEWRQRLGIGSEEQAALPGWVCVLTLPLWPSVKWDHVLPCLPHRAAARERGGRVSGATQVQAVIKRVLILGRHPGRRQSGRWDFHSRRGQDIHKFSSGGLYSLTCKMSRSGISTAG